MQPHITERYYSALHTQTGCIFKASVSGPMNSSAESAEKQPWISQRMIKDRKSKCCPSTRHVFPSHSVCKTSVLLHLYTQKALSNWNNRLKSFPRVCPRSHFCSLHLQRSFSKTSRCSLWGNNLIIARAQWVCLTLNSNCVIIERLIKTLSASEELSLIHRRSKHRCCSLYDMSLKLLNITSVIVQEGKIRFI